LIIGYPSSFDSARTPTVPRIAGRGKRGGGKKRQYALFPTFALTNPTKVDLVLVTIVMKGKEEGGGKERGGKGAPPHGRLLQIREQVYKLVIIGSQNVEKKGGGKKEERKITHSCFLF